MSAFSYQQYFSPLLFLQYVAPQRVYANTLMEDEKVATLGLPDQLPSPQGLFQSTLSPFFSISQVQLSLYEYRSKLLYIYVWFIQFHCYDDGQQLSAALPNIGDHVVINQKLSGFATHFPFQRFVTNWCKSLCF